MSEGTNILYNLSARYLIIITVSFIALFIISYPIYQLTQMERKFAKITYLEQELTHFNRTYLEVGFEYMYKNTTYYGSYYKSCEFNFDVCAGEYNALNKIKFIDVWYNINNPGDYRMKSPIVVIDIVIWIIATIIIMKFVYKTTRNYCREFCNAQIIALFREQNFEELVHACGIQSVQTINLDFDAEDRCAICLQSCDTKTNCGHTYCFKCLIECYFVNDLEICSICRQPISIRECQTAYLYNLNIV